MAATRRIVKRKSYASKKLSARKTSKPRHAKKASTRKCIKRTAKYGRKKSRKKRLDVQPYRRPIRRRRKKASAEKKSRRRTTKGKRRVKRERVPAWFTYVLEAVGDVVSKGLHPPSVDALDVWGDVARNLATMRLSVHPGQSKWDWLKMMMLYTGERPEFIETVRRYRNSEKMFDSVNNELVRSKMEDAVKC